MEYSFNVEHAKKYGVNQAIMIKNIAFWVTTNAANDKHYHDGRTWTYNSIEAFGKLFQFWTKRQINLCLNKLIVADVLKTGNYNKVKYDRTLWYAFSVEDDFIDSTILQKRKMDITEKSNPITQKVQPIPDTKPDTKPDEERLKPYLPLSKLLYTEHKKVDDKYMNGKNMDYIYYRWANDIRLLVEKDGRTIAEVEQVIRWVKKEGNFWFVNIMSGKKLRLQFPKLLLQMKQEGKKSGSFKGTDEELHSYDKFFGGNK